MGKSNGTKRVKKIQGRKKALTGFPSFTMISCGHIDGVRAEKGPPGVGVNSEELP